MRAGRWKVAFRSLGLVGLASFWLFGDGAGQLLGNQALGVVSLSCILIMVNLESSSERDVKEKLVVVVAVSLWYCHSILIDYIYSGVD